MMIHRLKNSIKSLQSTYYMKTQCQSYTSQNDHSILLWKDVSYTININSTNTKNNNNENSLIRQSLDIYIPETNYPRPLLPVCIFVHGGSWHRGNKSSGWYAPMGYAYARHGFVGVSINYRLSPNVQYPTHIEDVRNAICWVHENIEKFGGNPQQLILSGHSAGAHLIMQSVVENNGNKRWKSFLKNKAISSLISISGVYNIPHLSCYPVLGPWIVNSAFSEDKEKWREASPLVQVLKSKEQDLVSSLDFPILLLNAESDFHLKKDASDLLIAFEGKGKKNVEHVIVPERNHWNIMTHIHENAMDKTMKIISQFINQHTNKASD